MRLFSTPASVRLIGGFLLVLAIFAVAAFMSVSNIALIVEKTGEVRDLQDGWKKGMEVESFAARMDAAMADLMRGGNMDLVDEFKKNAEKLNNALEPEGIFKRQSTEDERKTLAKCAELARQVETFFDQEFVPALIAGDDQLVYKDRLTARAMIKELSALDKQIVLRLEMKIGTSLLEASGIRDTALRDTGLLLALAVVVGVTIALLASRSIAAPIRELVEATQAVASGDLTRRLGEKRRDEFGRLAESFNKMTGDLRENQQRLVQAEKMASLGRLAAGVAHEINNPIGVISGYAKLLSREKNLPPHVFEDLKVISEESELCRRIVQDLLMFSRGAPPAEEIVDLRKVVADVLERTRRARPKSPVTLITDICPDELLVRVDDNRLSQAIENIVRNAYEAMPGGGTLRVSLQARPRADTDGKPAAEAMFQDTGPGIPPSNLESIFEPFFSTKEKGTGLGLSIAYAAIKAYSGNLTVQSEQGKGAAFVIRLPLADGEQQK